MNNDDMKRRVRDANNIVDVIQASIGKLTRAGRNWKACCPFHNEKTPSFNINTEGQFFKCFGCGKGGDVFTFVMLMQRVEFAEALKILADRAGLRLEPMNPMAAEQHRKEKEWKSYLYKLNETAAKFFREQLFASVGQHALAYLSERGLNAEICERFLLGYAPKGGSPLLAKLRTQGAPERAVVAAGLATQDDDSGRVYDFFFDRLMFPIRDIEGRVIAFGGRILGVGEPKYLNTRETPLFSKKKNVYGIDLARAKIVETRKAIIAEGYTDVMMCHQFGVTNVVGCMGTAITEDHIQHLKRVADELLILTDSDKAGGDASEKSLNVLMEKEMPAKIVRLPGAAKDPCEFLLAHGREPFDEAMTHSTELFEFKFERVLKAFDVGTPNGLIKAIQELMKLISLVPNPLLKNEYRRRVSVRLNVSERELEYEAKRDAAKPALHSGRPPVEAEAHTDAGAIGEAPPPENDLAKTERELLKFLFHEPAWLEDAVTQLDFTVLFGKLERAISQAILLAMGEGKLPPDPAIITEDGASSLVAREVLKKLDDVPGGGVEMGSYAKRVCIDLASIDANAKPIGVSAEADDINGEKRGRPEKKQKKKESKLDTVSRYAMLLKQVKLAYLSNTLQILNGRIRTARLSGDAAAEEQADLEAIEVRKLLSQAKRQT